MLLDDLVFTGLTEPFFIISYGTRELLTTKVLAVVVVFYVVVLLMFFFMKFWVVGCRSDVDTKLVFSGEPTACLEEAFLTEV